MILSIGSDLLVIYKRLLGRKLLNVKPGIGIIKWKIFIAGWQREEGLISVKTSKETN